MKLQKITDGEGFGMLLVSDSSVTIPMSFSDPDEIDKVIEILGDLRDELNAENEALAKAELDFEHEHSAERMG